jgi:diacylglycerol O-acyltransferase / wax synthase
VRVENADNGTVDVVPLTAEDRAILELESSTVVGHTCKVILLRDRAPDIAALRARVAERISSTPELTRRLAETSEGWAWVPDDDFDVDRHVVAVPGLVARGQGLRGEVARLFAERLDRAHPLWRMDAVTLADGGGAVVWRVHHALADGTTLVRFAYALLLDEISVATPSTAPHPQGQPAPHTSAHADDVRRRQHLAGFLGREFARARDSSPFDGHIGTRREVAFVSTPLGDLHRAAKSLCGATLNDAVLTAVAGGLRRWVHEHHGHLGVVRVKVPVSLHHEGDDVANRDSFFTVGLPLNEPDPVARLLATKEATSVRKSDDDAATMDALLRHLAGVSPALERFCARIEQSPRAFAVNVSNVPGPHVAVTLLGAPVEALYSLAEIGQRHALRVAVVSLADTISFGICADPAIVHDLQTMAEGIRTESEALTAAAG